MDGMQRKPAKRAAEPIDEWLQSQGFFRKHAPRDPTCLFRAVSEQIYLTQHYHIRVREECVRFMKSYSKIFEKKISIPFDNYLTQMACFTEWGGSNEIEAMSDLYKREFIIFDGHILTKKVVNKNNYNKQIFLCYTDEKQYESVFTKECIASAAYCQSLVYKVLYEDVFKMPNVDATVHKMLHDKSHSFKQEKFDSKGNVEERENLATGLLYKIEEVEEREDKSIDKSGQTRLPYRGAHTPIPYRSAHTPPPYRGAHTPFPYRVAKALDKDIYRNTDFDNWHETRREVKNLGFSKYNGTEFQVGGKCLVEFNAKEDDLANNNDLDINDKKTEVNGEEASGSSVKLLTGHIQEMSKNEGPVVVFIVELGEKRTVPYSTLRPITIKKVKSNAITSPKKTPAVDQSPKCRKSFGPLIRKGKEQVVGCNQSSPNFDRNSNKGTPKKNSDNTMKWTDEPSESSKATFGKQWMTNYISPDEDFTADVDFPAQREKCEIHLLADEENLKKLCPLSSVPASSSDDSLQPLQLQSQPQSQPQPQPQPQPQSHPHPQPHPQPHPHPHPQPQPEQQNATYFVPPQQQNMTYFLSSTENNYQMFPFCGNDTLPNIGLLLSQSVHPINLAVTMSINADCTDLPLTDLQTLRFFYNLGIQYFRAAEWLCYGSNQPPIVNDQFSFAMENSAGQKPSNTSGSQEDVTQMANTQHQTQKENGENGLKEPLTHFNAIDEPPKQKNSLRNTSNERIRAPRFKKCIDSRNRNFVQMSRRNQQRETEFYQRNNRVKEGQCQQYQGSPRNGRNKFLHQVPVNKQYPLQSLLYPQPICNEAETYCPQNPGLIPFPYMHQVDSGDNNANPFPPVVYTGIDNYPQTYVPYYPPYVYPPQTIYPGMTPTNAQESWYQYPSHCIPPCVQFTPPSGI